MVVVVEECVKYTRYFSVSTMTRFVVCLCRLAGIRSDVGEFVQMQIEYATKNGEIGLGLEMIAGVLRSDVHFGAAMCREYLRLRDTNQCNALMEVYKEYSRVMVSFTFSI